MDSSRESSHQPVYSHHHESVSLHESMPRLQAPLSDPSRFSRLLLSCAWVQFHLGIAQLSLKIGISQILFNVRMTTMERNPRYAERAD